MINRFESNASPALALNETEVALLDNLVADKKASPEKNLSHYLMKIARLGGYLARSRDPPPGNMVLWRGITRLIDIELGFNIGKNFVGNGKAGITLTAYFDRKPYFGRDGCKSSSGLDKFPPRNCPTAWDTARATLRTSSCIAVSRSSASWLSAYDS